MIWDMAPKITLEEGRDYFATIEIFEGGEIKIDLLEELAPVTVNNFVFLSEQGYYDWVTFHRVIPDFMAQGGDPSGTGRGGPGYYIDNEFHPDARHDSAGVVSMANAGLLPDGQGTNGSQFFITFIKTPTLDGINSDGTLKDCSQGSCHSVFGRVIEGMNVLGSIFPRDPETANLPGDVIETIKIKSVPK
ncbi:MAG: peptidylprolyl isomerase [Dehalococcoidia bacterium]|nr:peptidylprolyl isomerase [Dehalococcoidia bacterium]